ncbi:MAG: NADH-quinone oxidoreductase subunit J [Alphaproteobacteria bacterium]|nr:NADH-quinone oxidoreductase subunit J [Alphaproteobacteria bacterium]MDE2335804.1 NADH-quinone oxidoreductase subunit J [Alphaproteobacteria bacterium]
MIEAIFFYLFSAILVLSALMVITARNPVHAVLFLILAFFNAAALFVMLGAEFIGMTLVIVYVGAVAVLFLFVVMMLDINFAALRKGMMKHLPVGGAVGLVLLGELLWIYKGWTPSMFAGQGARAPMPAGVDNTHALGQILYTQYLFPFETAGLILLVAMIGAITLTLRKRGDVRRQSVSDQVARDPKDVVKVVKAACGAGVEL